MPLLDCSMHMTRALFFRFRLVINCLMSFEIPQGSQCSIFVFSHESDFGEKMQVSVNDEGRDMWKVYLDMKVYAAALANCRDPLQRDQVYLSQVIFSPD